MFREPDYAETLHSRASEKSKNLKILSPLWKYSKPYKAKIIGAIIAIAFAAFSVLGFGKGLKILVDQGFGLQDTWFLYKSLCVMIGFVLILSISSFARVYFVSWVGERIVADLRIKIFKHLLILDPSFFEMRHVGDLISRLLTDTTLVQVVIATSIPIALRNLLLFFGGLILLLATSPKLTGIVALTIPVILGPLLLYGKKVRILSKASQERVGAVGAHTEEVFEAIRTVQAYVRESYEEERFSKKIEIAFMTALSQIKARAFLTMFVMMCIFGALCVVLWMGGVGVRQGVLTGGDLSSFLFYAALVAGAAGALSEIMGDLQRAAGAMERIFELLETKRSIQILSKSRKINTILNKIEKKKKAPLISFSHVSFSYPSRPHEKVLKDFSLDIYEGEHVAIVGASGVGKSTIFSLLLRFFDPHKGTIFFQGEDLRKWELNFIRNEIAWVSQDTVIFSGSIKDNVLYGNLEASTSEVETALKASRAWDFVSRLPRKVKALVGERGSSLSGGQKQRLALARAFIKNASVVLLDEATSALDALNERLIQEAIGNMWKGSTFLVIAHRLATIKKSDRIILLGPEGIILGMGTHQELLKTQPLYQEMVELEILT